MALRQRKAGFASGVVGLSILIPSRMARLAYLRTFRSGEFQRAAERLGYTRLELGILGEQLRLWSRTGRIGIEGNPLLGGFATPDRVTVGLSRLLVQGKPLRSAIGHELVHLLQEIRYGALTMEQGGRLRREQVRFFEWQAAAGGTLTVGGTPGWFEEFYGWLASWNFPREPHGLK